MKKWQAILEAFVQSEEPTTASFSHLRMTVQERQDALIYLLNQGFVEPAGAVHGEVPVKLYQATLIGRFMVQAGFTNIDVKRRSSKVQVVEKTLAKRVVEKCPTSVWDLARVPLRLPKFTR